MIDFILQNADFFGLAYIVVEYILGKTSWVKANSTIELILDGFIKIYNYFFKKNK
jgi:hypothetical protein